MSYAELSSQLFSNPHFGVSVFGLCPVKLCLDPKRPNRLINLKAFSQKNNAWANLANCLPSKLNVTTQTCGLKFICSTIGPPTDPHATAIIQTPSLGSLGVKSFQ